MVAYGVWDFEEHGSIVRTCEVCGHEHGVINENTYMNDVEDEHDHKSGSDLALHDFTHF